MLFLKSPVTVRACESGIRVNKLLLLQSREEIVRFVASAKVAEELAPPRFTALVPRALVLTVKRVPELTTVAPE